MCGAEAAWDQSPKLNCARPQPDGPAVVAKVSHWLLCRTTEKSLIAATSGCWASGFGPARTRLEDHRNVDGSTLPPLPLSTRTSCHCWLAPPQSVNCTTLAPSAVEAFWTSTALPLPRLTSTYDAFGSTVAACAVPAAPTPVRSAASKAATAASNPVRLPRPRRGTLHAAGHARLTGRRRA